MDSKFEMIRFPSSSKKNPMMLTPIPKIPAKKTRLELRIPTDFLMRMLHKEPQTAQPRANKTPV
jgi:hypothetical protein